MSLGVEYIITLHYAQKVAKGTALLLHFFESKCIRLLNFVFLGVFLVSLPPHCTTTALHSICIKIDPPAS